MRRYTLAVLLATAALPGVARAQALASDHTIGNRYDAMRRVTGTIAPDPDGAGPLGYAAVRNTYDAFGRLVRAETGELSSWQPDSVRPSDWSGFTVFREVDTSYDALNRKLRDTVSSVSGGTATAQTVTQYSYDPFGRPLCTAVRMNPASWTSQPDACVQTAAGGAGPDRITRNGYDDAGQLLTVEKAVGTPLRQVYASYSYTPNGRQASVTDANGNRAELGYDGLDRQDRWTFPSASTPGQVNAADYEQYGYDANGNRTSLRRRDGRVWGYTYDALNRVTAKALTSTACVQRCTSAPASALRSVYYGYDAWGRQTSARFDSPTGSDAVLSAYDGFGRLTSATTSMAGESRTLAYQYDADGNRTRVTHPDGQSFTYAFDGLDRELALYEGAGTGGTRVDAFGYDTDGSALTRLGATGSCAHANGQVTASFTGGVGYCHDGAGRLDALQIAIGAATTTTLSYNPASQITTEARSNDAYAYVGAVNANTAYTANGLNQYAAVGAATLGYDADGDLTSDGSTTYGYDAENRLVSASNGTALTYDPNGRLWQVTGASGATRFVYDGDQLTAEYDGNGNMLRRYVHGWAEDDPLFWYEGAGLGDRRALIADHEGSIVQVASAAGQSLAINSYDEYGKPAAGNLGRFQYTGQAWLPELGLYHYKARAYSPKLGRFLQTDPVGYNDQINLYAYVGNDPVDGRDPTGMEAGSCYGTSGSSCGMAGGSAPTLRGLIEGVSWVFAGIEVIAGGGPEDPVTDATAAATIRGGRALAAEARAAETGAGKAFTQAQKREIYAANRARNGGELRSDQSGMRLTPSQKSVKGVPTPKDAAQIDHHIPRSQGGTNDISNGRVLSAPENRAKSDTMPQRPTPPSPPQRKSWWPF